MVMSAENLNHLQSSRGLVGEGYLNVLRLPSARINWKPLLPMIKIQIQAGLTNGEIAEELGTTEGAVKSALHRFTEKGEISYRPRLKVNKDELLMMLLQGAVPYQVKDHYGVTAKTIYYHRKKFIAQGQIEAETLPMQVYVLAARNALICLLSEAGYTAPQIVEFIRANSPQIAITKKIVEGVRAKMIKDGIIGRHKRGQKDNHQEINIDDL